MLSSEMKTVPIRETARYSVRTLCTYTKARSRKVWSIVQRFDVLEEAIEHARGINDRPIAVFDLRCKVWPEVSLTRLSIHNQLAAGDYVLPAKTACQ